MKKIYFFLILVITGCAPFIMIGKTPPQVLDPQTLFFKVEADFVSVWNDIVFLLNREGKIYFSDKKDKLIKATLEDRDIEIIFAEPIEGLIYIYIRAFKDSKPDLPFAQKVANKIIREINSLW